MEIIKKKESEETYDLLLPEVKRIVNKYLYLRMVVEEICAHSPMTLQHTQRVGNLALIVSQGLEFSENEKDLLVQAGLAHDIGKTEIDISIVDKPSQFTDADREIMKDHPEKGFEYIRRYAPMVAEILVGHHEYQEFPYPRSQERRRNRKESYERRSEDDKKLIKKLSRILAIIDLFETYSGRRMHKEPEPLEEFLPRMKDRFHLQGDEKIIEELVRGLKLIGHPK
jgi:putative nucleotidyltransferase with HDIG domain